MNSPYADIIDLPRPISKTRPKMSANNRAAQFAPFAALAGHEEAVKETARLTEERIELDEYVKDALSRRLQFIKDRIKEQPRLSITHFKPDSKKTGGSYITSSGRVKKVQEYERIIVMTDGTEIPLDEVISIEGEIFYSLL